MKKQISIIIAAISVVVATGGITIGIKATNQKNDAQKKLEALRAQMKTQQGLPKQEPETTNATPLVALKDISVIDTNDVTTLQQQLDARDAEIARLQAQLAAQQNGRRPPRQSFQERMEQLKKEDPERYNEMVQRRTERQQQMRYDQAQRLAKFVNMDTSNMTPEELKNHNLLVDKLSDLWDKTGQFNPENPPDRETMRSMFETMREVRPLMDEERTYMLKDLGTEVGLSGGDVQDFASYVQDIYDATSFRFPGGRRGSRDRGNNGGGTQGGNSTPAGSAQ